MFVGHGPSNLPSDRIINVFHFTGTTNYEADVINAESAVLDFYQTLGPHSFTLGNYLSPWIQRQAEIRSYDLTTPKPRVPRVTPFELGASGATGYAEEVSVCLSYRGAPPHSPRRRGRIFFGPLRSSGVIDASSSDPTRPNANLVLDLGAAAVRLANNSLIQWVIRSTVPTENFVPIVDGWVDNALDTQRRRGPDPTARTLWSGSAL